MKKKMKKEVKIKSTCVGCERQFLASEALVIMVKAGRVASLCGYCDGSHE